jgi:hypothetical protein
MAIDPRIALGVQPVQIQSPLEVANQIAGLRAAEQRNALVQMQMREAERSLSEQNALRRRISTPDFFKQPNALETLTSEFGQPGAELFEAISKGRKAASEAKKTELDTEIAGAQAIGNYLGVAKDQRSWTQLYNEAKARGIDVSRISETYDPLAAETLRDSSLGYAKYLENLRANRTLDVQEGQLKTSQQRLAFDKEKEAWQRANPDFEIKDTGQGLLAINKKTGAVKPIIYNGEVVTGASKSADPRVDEQNTAFNAKRVLNSAKRIAEAVKRNPDAMSAGALEAAARGVPLIGEGAAALIRSEDRQVVEQNYEGIIDALLFMATGAAYNKEQREATINEIKPLFTDKAAALADKRGKLAEYIEAAKLKSGRAWTPELDAAMNVVLGMYGTPDAAAGDAGPAPQGVDQALWDVMTPEERAAWQK